MISNQLMANEKISRMLFLRDWQPISAIACFILMYQEKAMHLLLRCALCSPVNEEIAPVHCYRIISITFHPRRSDPGVLLLLELDARPHVRLS